MSRKVIFRILKWFFGIVLGFVLLITAVLYFFKDDICQLAIDKLNGHLKSKVYVNEVDLTFWGSFPNMSIDLNQVFVQDNFPGATREDTLLYSDRLRFKFDPWDLWNEDYKIKSIEVKPGVLSLKVNEEGESNYDIFKPADEASEEAIKMDLEEVSFEKFRFRYSNEATGQDYYTTIKSMDLVGSLSESVFNAKATSELNIISAQSKQIKLVKDKDAILDLTIQVNTDSNSVIIPASAISIAELPFNFEGFVKDSIYDFSLEGKDLKIDDVANKLAFEEGAEVRKFSGDGNLIFGLSINGDTKSEQGSDIDCHFGIEDATLKDPSTAVVLTNLKLDGNYTNHDAITGESLALNEISFRTQGGLFRGNVLLSNFEKPVYEGNADGLINLAILKSIFGLKQFEQLRGTVDVSSQFKISAEKLDNGKLAYGIDKCNGNMRLNGVDAQFRNDKRVFKSIRGMTYLRGDELGLHDISLTIGRSDFVLNGAFRSLISYLSKRGNLQADVELKSKLVDLADLGTESKEEKVEQQRTFLLPDDIEGEIYLKVGRLIYESHDFLNIGGNMVVSKRSIHFPRISLTSGGADINGTLTIEERRPEFFYISSQAASRNINFKQIFKEWNNFQQDIITSNNITGTAIASMNLEAPFDFRGGIIYDAIKANIAIEVQDGRLYNVGAFKDITESLRSTSAARMAIGKDNIDAFEKKLMDLRFEELKNNMYIENSVITIPTMSIKSNALDLEASGKHTFSNKIDYRFGFRFRDLKEREQSKFGEIEDDGTGKFVFLRMYGDLDNPIIEWDKATNRDKRKEKKEEEKKEVKSILKSEFGLFKNDSTVKTFIRGKKKDHETLELDVDPLNQIDTLIEITTPRKEGRLKKKLNQWKKEAEEAKKEEFELEG